MPPDKQIVSAALVVSIALVIAGCAGPRTERSALRDLDGWMTDVRAGVGQRLHDIGVAYPLNSEGAYSPDGGDYQTQLLRRSGTRGLWAKWKGPYLTPWKSPFGIDTTLVYQRGAWPAPEPGSTGVSRSAAAHIYLEIIDPTDEEWLSLERHYDGPGEIFTTMATTGRVIRQGGIVRLHIVDLPAEVVPASTE